MRRLADRTNKMSLPLPVGRSWISRVPTSLAATRTVSGRPLPHDASLVACSYWARVLAHEQAHTFQLAQRACGATCMLAQLACMHKALGDDTFA